LVEDTLTDQLFPHQLIPHYVWIAPSGRVMATTASEEVSAPFIRDVLDGVPPAFALKKDQDTDRPLFSSTDLPAAGLLNYAVLVKGWFEGLPSGNKIRQRDSVIYGRAIFNTSLLDMYKAIARGIDPSVTKTQFLIAPEDSLSLEAPRSGPEREVWYKENAYSLDVIVPRSEAAGLFPRMLEVLNQYSGYTGGFEGRMRKCWVLSKTNPAVRLHSKGGRLQNKLGEKDKPFLTNGSISLLVNHLANLPSINGIVLNETGYGGQLDLQLEEGFTDLASVQRNLSRQGLLLTRAERCVRVFVIRKKGTL